MPGWLKQLSGGRELVAQWQHGGIDLLFPPRCAFCGADLDRRPDAAQLCQACRAAMLNVSQPLCRKCAMPVSEVFAEAEDCARCRSQNFRFHHVWTMGIYRDRLREAVICMKRQSFEPLVHAVGRLLAESMGERIRQAAPQLIVPMPIHWSRRWSRGMNVAELLVESMDRKLRTGCTKNLLTCRRKLRKQGTLGPTERAANVRGAFRVSASYDIKNAHVLLVDDVMTTGATASEAARSLRQAGAACVNVMVAARAVGSD